VFINKKAERDSFEIDPVTFERKWVHKEAELKCSVCRANIINATKKEVLAAGIDRELKSKK
jgi:hypothetical protein